VVASGWGEINGLGGSARTYAGLPVRLFNDEEFNFAELDARGEAGRTVGESCFALSLKFGGQEIYYRGFNSDCTVPSTGGGTPGIGCNDPDVTVEGDLNELLTWKSDFFVEESKSATKNFTIAVVPITAHLEGSGKVGFLTNVSIPICEAGFTTTTFQAQAGPYAELGMQASGGVGTSKGFSGGVGGEATLLSDTFLATAQVELEFLTGPLRVVGQLTEDITNTLKGPFGSIFLFVKYPCVKWCKSWGIPYPCGWKQCQARKGIYDFASFEKEDVLLCKVSEETTIGGP